MAKFKDNKGREWTVSITVRTARQLKDDLGLDVMTFLDAEKVEDVHDVWAVADALGMLCEPQFERHGINATEFFEAMDGDAMESAVNAFVEAIVDFFPQRQREPLRALLAKTKVIEQTVARNLLAKVAELDPTKVAEELSLGA